MCAEQDCMTEHELPFPRLLAKIREETEEEARFQRYHRCFSGGVGSRVFVLESTVFEEDIVICALGDYWYARFSGRYEETKQRGLAERKAKEEACA